MYYPHTASLRAGCSRLPAKQANTNLLIQNKLQILYRLRTYFPNLPSYPLIPSSCYRNVYKSAGNVQITITTTSGYTPPKKIFFRVMLIDANNRSSARIKSPQLANYLPICNSYTYLQSSMQKAPCDATWILQRQYPPAAAGSKIIKKEQHLLLLSPNHNSMISFFHEIIPKYLNASSIAFSLSLGHGYAPLPSPFGLL